jgi:hypothetical protein
MKSIQEFTAYVEFDLPEGVHIWHLYGGQGCWRIQARSKESLEVAEEKIAEALQAMKTAVQA